MREPGFGCQVAGVPQGVDELAEALFAEDELLAMNSNHRYAALAALEAWQDAGLARPERGDDRVDWDTGAILGTGIGGMDTIAARVVPLRRSEEGAAARQHLGRAGDGERHLGARLGPARARQPGDDQLERVQHRHRGARDGAARIRNGLAERMLCGGAEGASHYIWAGFDAMRVLARGFNDEPEQASRPLSASAAGFVPGAGAGVLLLESLESAPSRGARIHAEVLGGASTAAATAAAAA